MVCACEGAGVAAGKGVPGGKASKRRVPGGLEGREDRVRLGPRGGEGGSLGGWGRDPAPGPHLEAADDVGVRGQQVHHLAFALVPPLRAQHHGHPGAGGRRLVLQPPPLDAACGGGPVVGGSGPRHAGSTLPLRWAAREPAAPGRRAIKRNRPGAGGGAGGGLSGAVTRRRDLQAAGSRPRNPPEPGGAAGRARVGGGARPDGALRGPSTRPGRGSPGNALGGYRARLPRGGAWTPRPSPPATLGPGPRRSRNRGGPLQGGSAVCQRGAASLRPTRGVRGAHLPRGEPGFSRLARAPSGGRRERTECLPHQRPPLPSPSHMGRGPGVWHWAPWYHRRAKSRSPAALGSQGPESREKGRCRQVTWLGTGAASDALQPHWAGVSKRPHQTSSLPQPVQGLGAQRGCTMGCWAPVFPAE